MGGPISRTGAVIGVVEVSRSFETRNEPEVDDNAPYSDRIRFEGVKREGSASKQDAVLRNDGVEGGVVVPGEFPTVRGRV